MTCCFAASSSTRQNENETKASRVRPCLLTFNPSHSAFAQLRTFDELAMMGYARTTTPTDTTTASTHWVRCSLTYFLCSQGRAIGRGLYPLSHSLSSPSRLAWCLDGLNIGYRREARRSADHRIQTFRPDSPKASLRLKRWRKCFPTVSVLWCRLVDAPPTSQSASYRTAV